MPTNPIRRQRPGEPISAGHTLNPIIDALEQSDLQVGAPLCVMKVAGGRLVRWGGVRGPTLVTIGGDIVAGTASAPTQGSATMKAFTGTAYAATTIAVVVFNWHDKKVLAGSLAEVTPMYGGYLFITDVFSCTNLA